MHGQRSRLRGSIYQTDKGVGEQGLKRVVKLYGIERPEMRARVRGQRDQLFGDGVRLEKGAEKQQGGGRRVGLINPLEGQRESCRDRRRVIAVGRPAPSQQVGPAFLVEGEVLADPAPVCFDVCPGLVERQGQTIHLPGEFAAILPVTCRCLRQSRSGWNEPGAPQEECRPLIFVHLLQVELAGTGPHYLPASGQG